jgi:hypothetical protein
LQSDRDELGKLGGEIARAAVVDIAGRGLVGIALGVAALVALLIWQGGSVPAWLAVAVVFALVVLTVTRWRRAAREEAALRREIGRNSEYSIHLQNSLDALQRVFSGDVEAEIPYFLDQAVLEPAQRILSEKPTERVRFIGPASRRRRSRPLVDAVVGGSLGDRKIEVRGTDQGDACPTCL